MMTLVRLPALVALGLLITACDDEDRDPTRVARFDLAQQVLPYPTDLHFFGSQDGTLNISPVTTPMQSALNALDGFSTTAVIREQFGAPLDATSLDNSTVHVFEVRIDNTTRLISRVEKELRLGSPASKADFSVRLATDSDSNGSTLEILPLKPLKPSAGSEGVGYLVVLTTGIKTAQGATVQADRDYSGLRFVRASCQRVSEPRNRYACTAVANQLQIAQRLGIKPEDVAVTFSFSTESTADTLQALANPAVTTAQPISLVNTNITTRALNPALPGHATLFRGTLNVPYYSSRPMAANPTAPLTASWTGSSAAPLTRFSPLPRATETIAIPVLVSVPNASSRGGGQKPASGWPVAIFQHGLARNRMDAVALADSYADAGYVVVAIDLPLHGITDAANPFYDARNERTFNLDLVNNDALTAGPDGKIDSTGTHFINLSSLLTTRDNARQAVADLLTLTRSLPSLSLGGTGSPDIDGTRIHFVGHSLGAITGGVLLGTAGRDELQTGVLACGGGDIVQALFDSEKLAPQFVKLLASQGIQKGTRQFAEFVRDGQTLIDAADPVNYIATAGARPLLLLQVTGGGTLADGKPSPADQFVPNSATERLITAANLPRASTVGDNPLSAGFVNFVFGSHGSILDPTSSPAATVEMQTEAIVFVSSGGTVIRITDRSVVQP